MGRGNAAELAGHAKGCYHRPMQEARDHDPARKRLRGLEGAVARLFTRAATVQAASTVAEGFRLLTLSGPALQKVAWVPGQKVQLLLGGWAQRTYTPLSWDAAQGSMTLLAFSHGAYPGSDWARSIAVGEPCAIFGPRASIDLSLSERPAVLFGDETSFGLAHALRHTPAGAGGVRLLLEVNSSEVARAALAAVEVSGAELVERQPEEAHFAQLERVATRLFEQERPRGWVLSGQAPSIARLVKLLRRLGVPRRQIQSKAYWAPGKVGLD
jgi:ferric-chelate reductase (NADPH)